MTTPPGRRALVAGDRGVLIELPDLEAALALHRWLQEQQAGPDAITGVVEVIPAARTVLVRFDPALISRAELVDQLDAVTAAPVRRDDVGEDAALLEIPVVYDGEDLDEVSRLLGVDPAEVVRRHTAAEYTMAFAGFAPGFGYLVGGDELLDVPRRTTPRVRIPAGSVGLAGRFSGVYPRESPGGWQLIGTTMMSMWDVHRDPPAVIRPGDRVRFVAVTEPAPALPSRAAPPPSAPTPPGPALIVERPGLRTLLQDAGREGHAAWGVSASGALDVPAMRTANRLVGNPEDTAVLEILLGRFRCRARGSVVVAVSGAPVPITVTRADAGASTEVIDCRPIDLQDGDVLTLGAPTSGLRAMLAVRGGFDAAPVLGSRSTDTLAGLGPAPVARGDVLLVGEARRAEPPTPEIIAWQELPRLAVTVPVDLGPRDDWFDPSSIDRLLSNDWIVSTQADRVGIRLTGEQPLTRVVDDELPSEGVVTGAVQVPSNGQPIIFLADHPLTGGYPVIAVVRSSALPVLAQVTPGMTIRFVLAD